jgi:hypothetical protein
VVEGGSDKGKERRYGWNGEEMVNCVIVERWDVSDHGVKNPGRWPYRTGTRITTDFAPWTPSTATSPSRLVVP